MLSLEKRSSFPGAVFLCAKNVQWVAGCPAYSCFALSGWKKVFLQSKISHENKKNSVSFYYRVAYNDTGEQRPGLI